MSYSKKWLNRLECCNCAASLPSYEAPAGIIRTIPYKNMVDIEPDHSESDDIEEGLIDHIDKKIHGKKDYWKRRME